MRRIIDRAQADLLRAIERLLTVEPATATLGGRGLPGFAIASLASEPWAALLYEGTRHLVEITLRGTVRAVAAARAEIEGALAEADFEMRGQFVYQIAVVSSDTTGDADLSVCALCVEAVTIAD